METFDTHIDGWREWQEAPWGRLRYTVARANLLRHLPAPPVRVLDAGGGNGLDALALAALGCHVTLLDASPEMLAGARRRADEQGLSERMIFYRAGMEALPDLVAPASFDVVLSHNVLQYVEDMPVALALLTRTLRPGGLLSVISVNRYSEVYRAALQQMDPAAALDQLDATTHSAGLFEVTVRRYTADDVIDRLGPLGCRLLAQYGIRCLTDYMADNELKADPAFFADLERLEIAVSGRHPYYLTARMFHIIARKDADAGETVHGT